MNILTWDSSKKGKAAVVIALIFHAVGWAGIVWIDQAGFVSMTPMNLLLSLALIFWTQKERDGAFFVFFLAAFQTGFFTEYLGVNHQLLFGHYRYEHALGFSYFGVPLMIGVNWFMIVYCSAAAAQMILKFTGISAHQSTSAALRFAEEILFIVIGALITMCFDWIMEPAAIQLGYWTWLSDAGIPIKNYRDWFLVSAFLLWLFRRLRVQAQNQFAIFLLLIQTLFFILLRFIL
jgi:putative membrane protein